MIDAPTDVSRVIYFGFGFGGLAMPVVSYAPLPMLNICDVSEVILWAWTARWLAHVLRTLHCTTTAHSKCSDHSSHA